MRSIGCRLIVDAVALAVLGGCGPDYSPNTYNSSAVQQANKVEVGVIVGARQVDVVTGGAIGAATGAAAGGIAGSQAGSGVTSAFGALGGALVGGLLGTATERATTDTTAYEYIVRKPNGDLVSVTQKDPIPLTIGMHVLVIAGNQARIVPDYTVPAAPGTMTATPGDGSPRQAGALPGAPPSGSPPAGSPPAGSPLGGPAGDTAGTAPPPAPVTASPLPPPTPAVAVPTPAVTPPVPPEAAAVGSALSSGSGSPTSLLPPTIPALTAPAPATKPPS